MNRIQVLERDEANRQKQNILKRCKLASNRKWTKDGKLARGRKLAKYGQLARDGEGVTQ